MSARTDVTDDLGPRSVSAALRASVCFSKAIARRSESLPASDGAWPPARSISKATNLAWRADRPSRSSLSVAVSTSTFLAPALVGEPGALAPPSPAEAGAPSAEGVLNSLSGSELSFPPRAVTKPLMAAVRNSRSSALSPLSMATVRKRSRRNLIPSEGR